MGDGKKQQSLIDIGYIRPDELVFPGKKSPDISLHGYAHCISDVDLHIVADKRFLSQRPEDPLGAASVDRFRCVDFIESGYALDDLSLHSVTHL